VSGGRATCPISVEKWGPCRSISARHGGSQIKLPLMASAHSARPRFTGGGALRRGQGSPAKSRDQRPQSPPRHARSRGCRGQQQGWHPLGLARQRPALPPCPGRRLTAKRLRCGFIPHQRSRRRLQTDGKTGQADPQPLSPLGTLEVALVVGRDSANSIRAKGIHAPHTKAGDMGAVCLQTLPVRKSTFQIRMGPYKAYPYTHLVISPEPAPTGNAGGMAESGTQCRGSSPPSVASVPALHAGMTASHRFVCNGMTMTLVAHFHLDRSWRASPPRNMKTVAASPVSARKQERSVLPSGGMSGSR
jgi:hypothetical protein